LRRQSRRSIGVAVSPAQSAERRHRNDLLARQVFPSDPARLAVCAAGADHAVGGDDEVDGDVVGRHRDVGVDDLQLVDGGQDGRSFVDGAELAGQRPLEIAVAAALADPGAASVDGDAAGHDEIDTAELAGQDGFAEPRGAADGGRFREPAAQARRIEPHEAAGGAQARDGHEHGLAVAQRAQPEGPLRRVGIALQPTRTRPLRQLRRAGRRALGPHEVRDPVLDGKGKPRDPSVAQERPHPLPERLLCLTACLRRRRHASTRP
jgi:hypothetical protein